MDYSVQLSGGRKIKCFSPDDTISDLVQDVSEEKLKVIWPDKQDAHELWGRLTGRNGWIEVSILYPDRGTVLRTHNVIQAIRAAGVQANREQEAALQELLRAGTERHYIENVTRNTLKCIRAWDESQCEAVWKTLIRDRWVDKDGNVLRTDTLNLPDDWRAWVKTHLEKLLLSGERAKMDAEHWKHELENIRAWDEADLGRVWQTLTHDLWIHEDGTVLRTDNAGEAIRKAGVPVNQWTTDQLRNVLCMGMMSKYNVPVAASRKKNNWAWGSEGRKQGEFAEFYQCDPTFDTLPGGEGTQLVSSEFVDSVSRALKDTVSRGLLLSFSAVKQREKSVSAGGVRISSFPEKKTRIFTTLPLYSERMKGAVKHPLFCNEGSSCTGAGNPHEHSRNVISYEDNVVFRGAQPVGLMDRHVALTHHATGLLGGLDGDVEHFVAIDLCAGANTQASRLFGTPNRHYPTWAAEYCKANDKSSACWAHAFFDHYGANTEEGGLQGIGVYANDNGWKPDKSGEFPVYGSIEFPDLTGVGGWTRKTFRSGRFSDKKKGANEDEPQVVFGLCAKDFVKDTATQWTKGGEGYPFLGGVCDLVDEEKVVYRGTSETLVHRDPEDDPEDGGGGATPLEYVLDCLCHYAAAKIPEAVPAECRGKELPTKIERLKERFGTTTKCDALVRQRITEFLHEHKIYMHLHLGFPCQSFSRVNQKYKRYNDPNRAIYEMLLDATLRMTHGLYDTGTVSDDWAKNRGGLCNSAVGKSDSGEVRCTLTLENGAYTDLWWKAVAFQKLLERIAPSPFVTDEIRTFYVDRHSLACADDETMVDHAARLGDIQRIEEFASRETKAEVERIIGVVAEEEAKKKEEKAQKVKEFGDLPEDVKKRIEALGECGYGGDKGKIEYMKRRGQHVVNLPKAAPDEAYRTAEENRILAILLHQKAAEWFEKEDDLESWLKEVPREHPEGGDFPKDSPPNKWGDFRRMDPKKRDLYRKKAVRYVYPIRAMHGEPEKLFETPYEVILFHFLRDTLPKGEMSVEDDDGGDDGGGGGGSPQTKRRGGPSPLTDVQKRHKAQRRTGAGPGSQRDALGAPEAASDSEPEPAASDSDSAPGIEVVPSPVWDDEGDAAEPEPEPEAPESGSTPGIEVVPSPVWDDEDEAAAEAEPAAMQVVDVHLPEPHDTMLPPGDTQPLPLGAQYDAATELLTFMILGDGSVSARQRTR